MTAVYRRRNYAGQTAAVIDPETGEELEAQIFVATMGASSHTYAEATWTQSLPDWIGAHVRAFAFFGGVPRLLVPDNLKSGVTSACHYEPGINETYARMAAHYRVAVLPARVRRPKVPIPIKVDTVSDLNWTAWSMRLLVG